MNKRLVKRALMKNVANSAYCAFGSITSQETRTKLICKWNEQEI